jgi:regulator of nonsense transcripts 2
MPAACCTQEYIRHLIFVELAETTIADVLRRLLRLPWAECEAYVLKCMFKVGGQQGV